MIYRQFGVIFNQFSVIKGIEFIEIFLRHFRGESVQRIFKVMFVLKAQT